jgi:predicted secreted protein
MIYSGSLVTLHVKLQDQWLVVGGMRLTKLVMNSQLVDASNSSSGGWRELMDEAGVNKVNIIGAGAFSNSKAEQYIQKLAFAGKLAEYKLNFANGSELLGLFKISHYERLGEMNEMENYVISLESSAKIFFEIV